MPSDIGRRFAVPLVLLLAAPLAATAQEPDHDAHQAPAAQAAPASPAMDMAGMMAKMMEARKQLAADLAKLDAELQTQIDAMRAATGEARIDAMASVIATMARQRTLIRERSMRMECDMMSRMMAPQADAAMKQKMMAGCAMMPAAPATPPAGN